jgi:hypothetical protein
MGCEWSQEEQLYLEAYNTHMTALLEANPPFAEGEEVVYRVQAGEDRVELRISRDRVERTVGTEVVTLSTTLRQRLEIGVLANQTAGRQVPAMIGVGDTMRRISVGSWSATWGAERQLISSELQLLLEDLLVTSDGSDEFRLEVGTD